MLYQIVSFLLDVVGGLLTGACLLRLYMQWQRVPFGNPVGRLVFALTDWLILPLRRAIPPARGIDWASLVAAMLVQLVQYLVLWIILGAGAGWAWLPWLALFGLLRVAITATMGLLIVHAVMSWTQARSQISDVIDRLAEPILRPVRRLLPPLGGVDLSPLVLIVLLQVLLMVVGHLQVSLWR
ncbi:MAG: YggT family protein [Giesbergeria sp.]